MSLDTTRSDTPPAARSAQVRATRVDLAALHRLAARFGFDDLVWNHITARVPGTQHAYLVGRFGLLHSEVTASNLLVVDSAGTIIEGDGDVNATALVIHTAVHNAQPDARFVFHSHAPEALAFCALDCELEFLQQDAGALYDRVGYHEWEGLSLDLAECDRLATNLGDNKALIMRNHGFLTVGATAGEAFVNMYYLVRAASVHLQAAASGLPRIAQNRDMWEKARDQYEHFAPGVYEWPALLRLLDAGEPGYRD